MRLHQDCPEYHDDADESIVGGWSLKWRDRNAKWHAYEGFDNVPHFRDALRQVDEDPAGIFLG